MLHGGGEDQVAYRRGDVVAGHAPDGSALARGQAQYNAGESARIAGRHSREIDSILGFRYGEALVHRDDLVLLQHAGNGKEAMA
jgi:glutamate 5-kinase